MGCGCFENKKDVYIPNIPTGQSIPNNSQQKQSDQVQKKKAKQTYSKTGQNLNSSSRQLKQEDKSRQNEIELTHITLQLQKKKQHKNSNPQNVPKSRGNLHNKQYEDSERNKQAKNKIVNKSLNKETSIIYCNESKIVIQQKNPKIQKRQEIDKAFYKFENINSKNQKKKLDFKKQNSKQKLTELNKRSIAVSVRKDSQSQGQFRQIIDSTFKIRPTDSTIKERIQKEAIVQKNQKTQYFNEHQRIDETKILSSQRQNMENNEVKIKRTDSQQVLQVDDISSCKSVEINNPENRNQKSKKKEEIKYYNYQSKVQVKQSQKQSGLVSASNKSINSQNPPIKQTKSQIIDNQQKQKDQKQKFRKQSIDKKNNEKNNEQKKQVKPQNNISDLSVTVIKAKKRKNSGGQAFQYNAQVTIKPRQSTNQALERKLKKIQKSKQKQQKQMSEQKQKQQKQVYADYKQDRDSEVLRNKSVFPKSKKVTKIEDEQNSDMIDSFLPMNTRYICQSGDKV